jgi:hypothetical protein
MLIVRPQVKADEKTKVRLEQYEATRRQDDVRIYVHTFRPYSSFLTDT